MPKYINAHEICPGLACMFDMQDALRTLNDELVAMLCQCRIGTQTAYKTSDEIEMTVWLLEGVSKHALFTVGLADGSYPCVFTSYDNQEKPIKFTVSNRSELDRAICSVMTLPWVAITLRNNISASFVIGIADVNSSPAPVAG